MTETDEQALIDRARTGDVRAFAGLVEKYQRIIYNLALRMVNDREDARDIAQTVLLKAYQNLGSFDGRSRFFSWIYRIAVNESLNHLSRKRGHLPLDAEHASENPGPEEDFESGRLARIVEAGLMELSPDQRAAIILRHFVELTHREMSDVLGVPEKTVKSRLFSARRQLGGILARKGVTHP